MNKIGFGFLRLPKQNADDENSIDFAAAAVLTDRFIALGGNYFDTAYTYQNGNSEAALREAVVKRYPRERLRIADKLPTWLVRTPEDCDRFFREQLRRCGVDYFDVYLLHGLDAENYAACEQWHGFGFLQRLKNEGKAHAVGFSYHDSPELLDEILAAHPEVDYVQLQINYLDWDSPAIQSRRCLETAAKHGRRIIVMEPVKGGNLAALPEAAAEVLRKLNPYASAASWAIRFAQSLEAVDIVLSGMNALNQIEDNMTADPFLNEAELDALKGAAEIVRSDTAVECTGCGYCRDACPLGMPIPGYFALYNEYARSKGEKWKMEYAYNALAQRHAAASQCIGCAACEGMCPQKLDIVQNLKKMSSIFENK